MAAVACLLWGITASVGKYQANQSIQKVRADANRQIDSVNQESALALEASRKRSLQRSADTAAAALSPFFALKGQVSEISDRSLQSVVRNLVKNESLRFVAVTDSSGKVLASSDLTMVGREVQPPARLEIATSSIGADQPMGSLMLGEEL